MARTDSGDSSGASLTSEDEDVVVRVTSRPHLPGPSSSTRVKHHAHHEEPIRDSPEPNESNLGGQAASRFRSTVGKVMAMRKSSYLLGADLGHGAEPGVDPRRASAHTHYGHIKENCEIEIVDYSPSKVTFTQYNNQELVDYLRSTNEPRPAWAKVRWINIGGISWDVISALAIKYDLHPLALENVLQGRKTSRSKADYYQSQLFIRILCHSLQEHDASPLEETLIEPTSVRVMSPTPMDEKTYEKTSISTGTANELESTAGNTRKQSKNSNRFFSRTRDEDRAAAESRISAADRAIDALKESTDRVHVKVRNLFLFLCRDGTLISIHQADRGFGDPILARLKQRDTVLRSTADSSLLLQALLDLVVDRAIDIVDKFHENILKLEQEVLIRPKMRTVRNLHIISGDLTLHRRTLDPLKTLIYGLRRYDTDRSMSHVGSEGSPAHPSTELEVDGIPVSVPKGFLSHKTKVYLNDVHDHMEFILASFEMFENISENLINYTFNIISYETNEVMRRLTLVTIIFLPLTFVSGYFGMNFDYMMVAENSDIYFWIISLPLMAVLLPLFLWSDFIRVWHFIQKHIIARRAYRDLD